eukprot:g8203.t1
MGETLTLYGTPAVLFALAIVCGLVALIVPVKLEEAIQNRLSQSILFTDASGQAYENWVSNEGPGAPEAFTYIWMFNITNDLNKITTKGEKVNVQKIGPYVYKNFYRNVNATFKDKNGERVVQFVPYVYLIFDEERSGVGLSQKDAITAPAIGFWSILNMRQLLDQLGAYDQILELVIPLFELKPWETHTVNEWLFGYPDPTLMTMKTLIDLGVVPTGTLLDTMPTRSQLLRNSTSPQQAQKQVGTSTLSLGFPNAARFQTIVEFQTHEVLDCWNYEQVTQQTSVQETADVVTTVTTTTTVKHKGLRVDAPIGNFFGFRMGDDDVDKQLFWSLVMRTLRLVRTEKDVEYKGLTLNRFEIDQAEFLNAEENPANARWGQVWHSGVFNLTSCLNAAFFMSQWNFLGAGHFRTFTTGVESPNLNDKTLIDVEPLSGAAVRSTRKIQGNIRVGGLQDNVTNDFNIPGPGLIPQYQADFRSFITDKQASDLQEAHQFVARSRAAMTVCAVIGGLGLLLALGGLGLAIVRVRRKPKGYLLEDVETDSLINTPAKRRAEDASYGTDARDSPVTKTQDQTEDK